MAHDIDIGKAAGPVGPPPAEPEKPPQFGLTTAIALIVGSIIGAGIFNLPTSLAGYGPITLVSMALTTVGALALALLFGALSRRLPADGGPYAYARVAFGNRFGFANAWSYWITVWAGNAAIAVGWVLYVEHFINTGHTKWITVAILAAGAVFVTFVFTTLIHEPASIAALPIILALSAVLDLSWKYFRAGG